MVLVCLEEVRSALLESHVLLSFASLLLCIGFETESSQ